jgi:hypothetical protein
VKETEFQRHILAAFDGDPNVKLYRRNVGGLKKDDGQYIRFGQAGQADLYGWITEYRCSRCGTTLYGVHAEIEVKSDTGKPTPRQEAWLEMVRATNGIAILVYPEPNDPIGLGIRIWKLLTEQPCPHCKRAGSTEKRGTIETMSVDEYKRRYT